MKPPDPLTLPYVQEADCPVKAVRLPDGSFRAVAEMSEAELWTYTDRLALELQTGIAVLKSLGEYARKRFGGGG